jgi:hypothetical protein
MRMVLLVFSALLGIAAVTLSCIGGESKSRATPRLRAVHRDVTERGAPVASELDHREGFASPTPRP